MLRAVRVPHGGIAAGVPCCTGVSRLRKGGNHMQRKASILLGLLLLLSLLCGCRIYLGEHHDLYQQIKSNVLCTNGTQPNLGIQIEVVERDDYGRRLFRYSMYVDGTDDYEWICVIAVSQQTKWRWVYYYEDINFIMAETFEEIEDSAIEALKTCNDWGQPLDAQKMTKRKIYGEWDGDRGHHKLVYNNFMETMPVPPGGDVSVRLSDFDGKGKTLYYYFIYDADWKDNVAVDTRSYIAVINEDGTYDAETWIAELEDIYGYQEQLHALKLANGWTFGTG